MVCKYGPKSVIEEKRKSIKKERERDKKKYVPCIGVRERCVGGGEDDIICTEVD